MVLSMERWVGKVAIVTGASTGIGAAIAEKLVWEGLIVVGLARRSEKIEELSKKLSDAKGKLHEFKTDVTKEQDIKDAFDWTTKNIGPVHILINNAGIHLRENLIDGNTETWRKTLDVNVLALCIASREAIKIMRENNIDGHIIHINSICGHKIINLPKMDIYTASKYAVTAITDTMRDELVAFNTKIKVSSISPGAVDTPIFDNIRNTESFKEQIGQTILNPEDIADGVSYVLSTPPRVQVLVTPLPGLPSNATSAPPGDPAPLIWPIPFDSPLPLDASEGGLFAGGFVPPPPRPTFIDDSATPDGPTTCDLCSWAWQNTGGGTSSGGGGYGVFDAAVEVPGEIGWVLTLVIVSLTSAIIGAIVMIVVLHCKRIKTSSENEPDHGGVSLEQMAAGRQRLPMTGAGDRQEDKEIVSGAVSVLTGFPSEGRHLRPPGNLAAHHHHNHHTAVNGVWSWLARRSSGCQTHHQQFASPATLPVENHYTHMEDGYNSVSGRAPSTVPAGDEDALYAELDRSASPSPSDASPAYQNSAYADPDAPPSAPSSAYYSDLSTHTAGAAAMPPPPLPPPQQQQQSNTERAYEVVGLATLHPACWGDSGRSKLEAISEHGTVPSDYV